MFPIEVKRRLGCRQHVRRKQMERTMWMRTRAIIHPNKREGEREKDGSTEFHTRQQLPDRTRPVLLPLDVTHRA
jgi:hypothetical protein